MWCTPGSHGSSSRCEISRSPSYRALPATSPVHARPVEPRTFQFDSRGCPVRRHLRPRAEKAGRISSNRLLQLAEVKRLPRAKNEIWYQRIPDPQQRPEGDQGSKGGCLKRARARLSPSVILNLDVLHANQAPLPVIWRHSRSSAFPRALDAVTECSQSTHPTHRWMRKPGSPFEEHFGQQAPAAQLTGAQAPAGELLGHRSPARSRAAFAPRPSGRSCWPLTASAPARQISSVKRTQSTRCG